MPSVMPEGENIQKAIKWISANIGADKKLLIQQLIEKAALKFDLSPKDTEFLFGFFRKHQEGK